MKFVKTVSDRVKKFVKGNGGTLPKLFVWCYAAAFLACGMITIFGIVYEFWLKNIINYKAINDFVSTYFTPSICGTFTLLGVLLIDKNKDGIPDKWEEGDDKNEHDSNKQNDSGHVR